MRALERFDLVAARVQQRRQLVEGEHDVGAQLMLDAHRHLGGEAVFRAIDVAGEHDAVIVDDGVRGLDRLHLDGRVARIGVAGKLLREDLLEASAQGEDLEAARIRVGRARPVHEGREAAGLVDDVGARLEVEVIGVGQHRLGAERSHHIRGERLDVRLGSHGNEGRRGNGAVRGVNDAGSPQAALGAQARADLESAVGAVGSRRGRGREGRDLLGSGGGEPVVLHRSNTSSFFRPSLRRMAAITG